MLARTVTSAVRAVSRIQTSVTVAPLIATASPVIARCVSGSAAVLDEADVEMNAALGAPRETMEYDLVVVGGGPAGLSAAIRFKQLAIEAQQDLSVVVLEKGAGEQLQHVQDWIVRFVVWGFDPVHEFWSS